MLLYCTLAVIVSATPQAEAPPGAVDPHPATPNPGMKIEPAHKKLKSYLPGELCEAFMDTGMKYDLYDWQVPFSNGAVACYTATLPLTAGTTTVMIVLVRMKEVLILL